MKTIKTYLKFKYQKLTRGFDDSEIWNLDVTTANFLLPRLKRFKEINFGYPGEFNSMEEWNVILDDIIFAMEHTVKDTRGELSKREVKRVTRGNMLFGKYFKHLWW
jgi:hypothetical protein